MVTITPPRNPQNVVSNAMWKALRPSAECGGGGLYAIVDTATGSATTGLGAAVAGCAPLSAVSFWPIALDACERAGWSTPVAKPTASVPARGFVSSSTADLEVARDTPARASRLFVNPGGITTAVYSLATSI